MLGACAAPRQSVRVLLACRLTLLPAYVTMPATHPSHRGVKTPGPIANAESRETEASASASAGVFQQVVVLPLLWMVSTHASKLQTSVHLGSRARTVTFALFRIVSSLSLPTLGGGAKHPVCK